MNSKQFFIAKNSKSTLDLNGNASSSKLNLNIYDNSKAHDNLMNVDGASTSINNDIPQLLSQIKNLNINRPVVSGAYRLVGKIERIVRALGFALVSSTSMSDIMEIGTPVFIVPANDSEDNDDDDDDDNPKYVLLGTVDDIMDSVRSPIYLISLESSILENTNAIINSFVYTISNHPSTSIPCVQCWRH